MQGRGGTHVGQATAALLLATRDEQLRSASVRRDFADLIAAYREIDAPTS